MEKVGSEEKSKSIQFIVLEVENSNFMAAAILKNYLYKPRQFSPVYNN